MTHVRFATIALLTCSNVFMTFARYAHLRNFQSKPWYVAALVSWQPFKLDFIWAGLCLLGAVYFMFRS